MKPWIACLWPPGLLIVSIGIGPLEITYSGRWVDEYIKGGIEFEWHRPKPPTPKE